MIIHALMETTTCFLNGLLSIILVYSAMAFLAIQATNTTTDQSSLLALKAHITHDPHNLLANNWTTTSTSVCNWVGITCDSQNNRVAALNLTSMNLTGTIPPQIGNLSFLVQLSLRNNSFHGSLPIELVQLRRLEILHLGNNSFQGDIPSWLGSLPKLQILNLFGTIPPTIFNLSSLDTIDLSMNSLSGSLPDDMCQYLPALQRLILHHNQLEGSIPSSLWQCKELLRISLDNNKFTGTIPRNIGKLSLLKELYLDTNDLEGELPAELGSLHALQILTTGDNHITGALSGRKLLGRTYTKKSSKLYLALGNRTKREQLDWKVQVIKAFKCREFIDNRRRDTIKKECSIRTAGNEIASLMETTCFLTGVSIILVYSEMAFLAIEATNITTDQSSLLALKAHITHDPHNLLANNWTASTSVCNWVGITCDSQNNSHSLESYLSESYRHHSAHIGNLSFLVQLRLINNSFHGSLPVDIVHLRRLEILYLGYNTFQGEIAWLLA
ncbi:hypothetical protein EZV62_026839 [Acer yangbiense]|uniref:Leucine-rich repeat-containing N-terminal plant-type domain-containing protein n=1 Tax=Acer yangbiense TaxID=1000413 RepID=A0A5C7GSJ4_9ROSI|nr:hypothetical protein EZV62_026839 [Acer yangbiense]